MMNRKSKTNTIPRTRNLTNSRAQTAPLPHGTGCIPGHWAGRIPGPRAGWILGLLFLTVLWSGPLLNRVSAQSRLSFQVEVPAVALVDIEPDGQSNLILDVALPTEAGQPFQAMTVTDQSLWLNYTSSLPWLGPSRSIFVQAAGTLPSGVSIRVTAAPRASGMGKGYFGLPVSGPVTIGYQPQLLISGIRGCHTGDGAGAGHRLTYTIDITDYDLTDLLENQVIQISYTITDL